MPSGSTTGGGIIHNNNNNNNEVDIGENDTNVLKYCGKNRANFTDRYCKGCYKAHKKICQKRGCTFDFKLVGSTCMR